MYIMYEFMGVRMYYYIFHPPPLAKFLNTPLLGTQLGCSEVMHCFGAAYNFEEIKVTKFNEYRQKTTIITVIHRYSYRSSTRSMRPLFIAAYYNSYL
jgi:hypothetical protein